MRIRVRELFLFGMFSTMLLVGVAAKAEEKPVRECRAEELDIDAIMPMQSAPESTAHSLAIEIRNRGKAACALNGLAIKFPPDERQPNLEGWALDKDLSAQKFQDRARRLEPDDAAHILLAWSSAPFHVPGLVMDDCKSYGTMAFSLSSFYDKKVDLEIRHLWMKTCGTIGLSSYRFGPYVAGEPISNEWIERTGLRASDFGKRAPARAQEAAGNAPNLRSLENVEYLADSFGSGYTGYFELFLKTTSPAFPTCAFNRLRKREADGQTIIYVNHCDDRLSDKPKQDTSKERRVLIRNLGLLPERTGRVEYDVVSEVVRNGRHFLQRGKTAVTVRDPKEPMLPAIATDTLGCVASQLRLTAPPVELGAHWKDPRVHAPAGKEWRDGKVFELTNISDRPCMLGGVPELEFSLPAEEKGASFHPEVCRNCATSLFKPRESRWIELKPNESAHFMVARRVLDPDYWFLCSIIAGIDLTFPGDKQKIALPFDAGSCGPVTVTAWRPGRYDDDPMNVSYDEKVRQRQQRRFAELKQIPKECADEVTEDTGRPLMFPSQGAIVPGLSSRPAKYKRGPLVLLWLYNPTDTVQNVMTCEDIGRFWLEDIDVFDSAGQRVLDHSEEKERKSPEPSKSPFRSGCLSFCTRNFAIPVQPHTCVHGAFSAPTFDYSRSLQANYTLPPGTYYVLPREKAGKTCRSSTKSVPDPTVGLEVNVEEE